MDDVNSDPGPYYILLFSDSSDSVWKLNDVDVSKNVICLTNPAFESCSDE